MNVETGTIVKRWQNAEVPVAAYSNDGRWLAMSGAGASAKQLVTVWDVLKGELSRTLLDSDDGSSLAFSPDGRMLAVACAKGIALWNVQTGALVVVIDKQQDSKVLFSSDGVLVTTTADKVKFWDVNALR